MVDIESAARCTYCVCRTHRTRALCAHCVCRTRIERALPTAPPLSLTGASRLLTLGETSVGAATPRRLEPGMCCALLGAIIVVKYRTFETCEMWISCNPLNEPKWYTDTLLALQKQFATWTSLRIEWLYRQARRTEERVSRQGCRGGCCGGLRSL